MGLKCKISFQDGIARVTDDSGNPSQLYERVLRVTENQTQALDVWATAYTEDFGNKGEDASVIDLMKYFDSKVASEEELSPSEVLQTRDFMKRNGFKSLDELNQQLVKIFKAEGVFNIDPIEGVASGLYSQEALRGLDTAKVQRLLLKIEGNLTFEDVLVEPEGQLYEYHNTSVKTAFDTFEKVSQKEIDNDIIKNVDTFTDTASFYEGIKNLPYPEFVSRFMEDKAFANEVMGRFKDLKKIPKLSLVEGNLSSGNNKVLTTVKNTILANTDNITVESEIDYLDSIDQDIWEENQDAIKGVLLEVEETLADVNIDVIGMSELSHKREEIMELLEDANDLLGNPTDATIRAFSDSHDALMQTSDTIVAEKLDEAYVGYNIVSLQSEKSDAELFNNFGLIKVGENLYHNVDQNSSVDALRDFLYNEYKEGNIEIPSEFLLTKDTKDKPGVLEDISRYLMSRPTDLQIVNRELYSAYQVAFNHKPLAKKFSDIKGLTNIKTDEKYLKSEFISDFYNYILKEKLKNSDIYRSTLSKFEINDRDITLTEAVETIDGLKFSEELADYIRLKKDSNMKYLVDTDNFISEDLLAINFPQEVSEYDGNIIMDGEYAITDPTSSEYININNELYRREMLKDNANLFVKVTTPPSSTYYSSGTNFNYDRDAAKVVFDKYGTLSPQSVDNTQFQNTVAKSRVNDTLADEFREKSTLKDNSYTFFEEGNSIVAYKDGNKVGTMTYNEQLDSYSEPNVIVDQAHRGQGIGTELYLRLMDKSSKEGKTLFPPTTETKQSKNILSRTKDIAVKQPDGGVKFEVRAYHGSPHIIQGGFKTDKIGTGEGMQAFGWGLYFTDVKDVASYYANNNSQNVNNRYLNLLESDFGITGIDEAIEFLEDQFYAEDAKQLREIKGVISFLKQQKRGGSTDINNLIEKGRIYSTTLHKGKKSNEYQWMEWYKPVNEKAKDLASEIITSDSALDALGISERYDVDSYDGGKTWKVGDTSKIGEDGEFVQTFNSEAEANNEANKLNIKDTEITGSSFYEALSEQLGSTKEASLLLLENGIDGVKYPADSLAMIDTKEESEGTNYVVFDENAVTIEEDTKFQEKQYEHVPTTKRAIRAVVDRLQKTGLSRDKVVYDRRGFRKMLTAIKEHEGIPASLSQLKNTIYGFENDGIVYLNPKLLNMNTLVHEFGHLWTNWAKESRNDLYTRGLDLVKDTPYHKMMIEESKDPNSIYSRLSEEDILEESLVRAIGDRGESIINKNKKSKVKEWLSELWEDIKNAVGLSAMATEDVVNLNLRQFADAVATDIMKGEDFKKKQLENVYYAPKEKVENISTIFDSRLELLDLYSPKEEMEILKDIDSCGR